MSVTFSADTDDSGLGLDGTVHNNAWKQAMATAINASFGDWTNVTFNAGNYTAATGSWTLASGDQVRSRYQILNKTLIWQIILDTTTVSATPLSLRIAIPTGTFATTSQFQRLAAFTDNGTTRDVYAQPGDTTHLYLFRLDGANFSTATDATYVKMTGVWELA